jgi:tetratricopeptide (TPR) repeat protein
LNIDRPAVEATSRQHEETIVPVKPGLRAAPAEAARAPEPRSGSAFWTIAGGAVLLVMAFGAFVLLPRWMERRAPVAPQAATEAPVAPEPEKPRLSPQELAALERQADELLANLLTQQRRLGELRAESWGGEQWQRYSDLGTNGDDAYLEKDFQAAVASYSEATALGDELLGRSVQLVDSALVAAQQAFEAGNADVAIGQYDLVLGIEPEHGVAKAGRARAERLPEVLELVRRGDEQRQAGELEPALASYRGALAIDAEWEPARAASAAVSTELLNAEFERALSLGFAALAAEDFAAAGEHFTAALKLRPQSREALDGRTQAAEGAKLDEIALAEARALAFERRELWPQAIAQYRAALETDPALQFAINGLERSEARLSLEAKLKNLIDNPTLLFSDTVLADSRKLVVEAKALEEPGPRLTEQIDKLDRLVTLAATPVTVELRSDQLTEVTLFRMGPLGTFTAKQVELRPGTYTAIGSRDGYRDVRQTFTVVPGRDLQPISVICVEPI